MILATVLAAGAGCTFTMWGLFHVTSYQDVRAARRSGVYRTDPFGPLHPWPGTELGVNPDTRVSYVAYDLTGGGAAELRFCPPADCRYWSATLYDHFMQSVPPHGTPTHHNHHTAPPLDGPVLITLGAGCGAGHRLDVSRCPVGFVAVRVMGSEQSGEGELTRVSS